MVLEFVAAIEPPVVIVVRDALNMETSSAKKLTLR